MSTPPAGGTGPGEGDPRSGEGQGGWGTAPPPPGEQAWGGQGGQTPGQPPAAPQWGSDPQGHGYAQVREHAPGAVASLVLGILGLFTIPLILSIIAVVLGNQSKRAAAAEPQRYNDQLGQVGRILGWIGIGLAVAGILVLVFLLVALLPVRAM